MAPAHRPVFFASSTAIPTGRKMIVLRCSRCDKEIEVSEPLTHQTVVCPNCGQLLAKGAAAVRSAHPDESTGETLAPPSERDTAPADTDDFPFLTPARGSNELGWLGRYR